ncbi:sugar phosphate isomerase [Paenibacillus darwinianus]|uniref:Sugar phosphate isomerase n=1 Tax=Paenibacillus darwinianus TaxID=1380763 RepID=A0A9W5S025_9BACL|nr:TIM barrel protein [Paenibacillus darwinianus]EXX85773.1 sugar phosphate isomerase [Paenibacillus darwinianus]EXX85956.1 sugar phosphate isomerase [Paenibacillus darwinianus]EXX88664.1 sugar phosphate isomerase [Paenibacillus darwinianus]
MPVLSLNAWSFERYMGPLRLIEWNEDTKEQVLKVSNRPEEMSLSAMLAKLARRGYRAAEIPYCHLQDTSEEGLEHLRDQARMQNVQLTSLLLDYGDLSSADSLRRRIDLTWYRRWIDIAADGGFVCVRIPAGESEPGDRPAIMRAADGLRHAAEYAKSRNVRVVTENIGSLLSTSDNVKHLLEACGGRVGLTVDFGNFPKDKYRQLADVMPYADTVHAKAKTKSGGIVDEDDFYRCLELCANAGFRGPLSLTYLDDGDAWEALDGLRSMAENVMNKPA